MDKIKFPKMHSSEKFKIDTGEEFIITHEKPGYGKGGILSLKRASDGYSYGTFRYGSNGMTDFGTLTEAKRSLKTQVTYVEKAYQKEAEKKAAQKSESAAKMKQLKVDGDKIEISEMSGEEYRAYQKNAKPYSYTSGSGGSNSGERSSAGTGIYEDAPF